MVKWIWFWLCVGSPLSLWAQQTEVAQVPKDLPTVDPQEEPLAVLNLRATKGAAAGYVADSACRLCHAPIYDSYQDVGMAQSFASPANVREIERFGETYYHEPTQRYYRIDKDGEKLVFHRYMKDEDGKSINAFETEIAWVMGSGNRARSYLYRNNWGELYMLPLGWYSEDDMWEMSPGFEFEDQMGILRPIRRQCMFCHNALPEVPAGSDVHWGDHRFPESLPQGTGCQRCHGPGADHIRAVLRGKSLPDIRSQIVNPAKLTPEKRDSVCFQCHMLPAVSMVGTRRFDRFDYSFRPGELISDYMLHVEVGIEGVAKEDFFEINHHGYRFWQSACYQESDGALACISCHDPHVKPTSANFRNKVSQVCRDCHAQDVEQHKLAVEANTDCTPCHMPTRRTLDVVHVTMTDHRIAKGPFDQAALVAPVEKKAPVIVEMELLPFGDPPSGPLAEMYRIITTFRNGFQSDALPVMARLLSQQRPTSVQPYLDFGDKLNQAREFAAAEHTARLILKKRADFYPALDILGVSLLAQGKKAAARDIFLRSLELHETPQTHYNLALTLISLGKHEQAMTHLDRAIDMRFNLHAAWLYRGRLFKKQGDLAKARDQLKRALEIEPTYTAAYGELIAVLRALDQQQEAARYLALGLRVAKQPDALQALAPKPNHESGDDR